MTKLNLALLQYMRDSEQLVFTIEELEHDLPEGDNQPLIVNASRWGWLSKYRISELGNIHYNEELKLAVYLDYPKDVNTVELALKMRDVMVDRIKEKIAPLEDLLAGVTHGALKIKKLGGKE